MCLLFLSTPLKISSIIELGFSFLGLSEVNIVKSLCLETILPIKGLFDLSLLPPHPITVINFLSTFFISVIACNTFEIASGVCA
jgi:hypothetical protein